MEREVMDIDKVNSVEPVKVSHTRQSITKEASQPSTPIKNMAGLKQAELQGSVSISEQQLIRAIDRAIKHMQGPTTSLEFSVHNKTHEIMVKVTDKDTGEVIREIPPEKTLDFVAKLWEMAGILIDERR
ncbi:flagellar protein FlaG [Paenibacillus albiflavus]|uniref:Flagellar protein FlaG n=2 Tax=Paenibacillus albiflavus TaxID=2545760 RepID=A0A4V2WNV0_9BACL|nr:flagellar protein FlaG [Paenibacillus albiflavus]